MNIGARRTALESTTMRVLAILVVIVAACRAQSDEGQLQSLLKTMERAEQTGDFDTWVGLWTPEKAKELEGIRAVAKARPDVRYRATTTYVHGDRAVMLVEGTPRTFLTMTLRQESRQWKIADEVWRDRAADPKSVYAIVPPEPGAFARAGSPWEQVAAAVNAGEAARLGWNLKAVFDEAYLYLRIESSEPLPAPGSTTDKPPGGWQVLKIDVAGVGEFVLYDEVNIGDQATFGKGGKANSHRPFAAYMIRMERRPGGEVFSTTAGLDPSPLLSVAEHDYDIRIPLVTLGIRDSRATRMTIGDAQWPKSAVLSMVARRYPR